MPPDFGNGCAQTRKALAELRYARLLVSPADSTGRCNTIETVDPAIFPQGKRPVGSIRSKPSQDCVLGDLTWWALLALVFQRNARSSLVLRRPIETTGLTGEVGSGTNTVALGRDSVTE